MIFAALCWSLSLLGPLFFPCQLLFIGFTFKSSLAFLICTSDNVALGFREHCGVVISSYINFSELIGSWYLTMYLWFENTLIKIANRLADIFCSSPQTWSRKKKSNFFFIIFPEAVIVPVRFVMYLYRKGRLMLLKLRVPLWPNGFEPPIAL